MPPLSKINQLYNININSSERVTKGFLSENYILFTNETRFFLKKYRFDVPEKIKEIHASKKYFSDGGIPVILPIVHSAGETVFENEGSYFALFPFVEARHIDIDFLTKDAIISFGKTLARIHLLGKEAKLPFSKSFKVESDEVVLQKIEDIFKKINEIKIPTSFDKIALKNLELKKTLLLQNQKFIDSSYFKKDHLIHGDYLLHNTFFDENDAVQWVFDFEKTDYKPRVYELFRSMFYSLFSENITQENLQYIKIYIDAYSSVYPIDEEEIKNGLQFYFNKIIRGFWVETEHYLNGNNRVDEFIFSDYARIKYISENMGSLVSFLISK